MVKTTLLGLCAGLDYPTAGSIELCGMSLQDLNEDERASLRNKEVGFIFQNFQLLPTLTALEKCNGAFGITRKQKRHRSMAKSY